MARTASSHRLVGVGAGGHAKNVIDAVTAAGRARVAMLLDDDPSTWGTRVLGVPVQGSSALLEEIRASGVANAFIGVGGIPAPSVRRVVMDRLTDAGFRVPPIVHPAATVSAWALPAAGCQVLAGAVINPDAHIGQGVVIGTGAIVGHDTVVDDFAHVAAGARLGGRVRVGAGALVGSGAVVLQGISVGDGATIGAGAVVTRDVDDGATVLGIPAQADSRPVQEVA